MNAQHFMPAQQALTSADFLNEWLDERMIEKEWGSFELVPGFVPAFRIITHDIDGTPRPELSLTRYKRAEAKYMSAPGTGTVIYAPQPDSWQRWQDAKLKYIAEGEGKALALAGLDVPVLGIRGVQNWHERGKKELHPLLAARIRPGDVVRLAIDGDWTTNKSVQRGTYQLMDALRKLGAVPELMVLPPLPGHTKTGIDDLLAVMRRGPLPVTAAHLEQIQRVAEIPSPFLVDIKKPLDTAEGFVGLHYTHDDGPTLAHWQGEFYRWEGTCWRTHGEELLRKELYYFLRVPGFDPSNMHVTRLLDALRSVAQVNVREAPAWLSGIGPDPAELLACANGLLYVRSGQLLEATPRFFNLSASSVPHDSAATCPRWEQFIGEVYRDDHEASQCLQEFMGYSLTDDTRQQKAIALIGDKRSGKGTIMRAVRALVGESNCCAPTMESLSQDFGLQTWIGKKIALVADARLGVRQNSQSMVERLLTITGEDTQYVNRKNRIPWEGRLKARIWIASNMLPATQDYGAALASRFLVINHTQSFYGREDTTLEVKLLQELPGILNWALAGLQRLHARGHFIQPASGHESVREWERGMAPVLAFVQDCCELAPDAHVETAVLRNAFDRWSVSNHIQRTPTANHFTQELLAAAGQRIGKSQKNMPDGRKGVRCYTGIRLVAEPQGPKYM